MITKRQQALDTASGLIHGDRTRYGPPKVNFQRIADRWSQVLKVEPAIEPWQVAVMLTDLKISRLCEGFHDDSLIDAIGYLALAMEVGDDG